MLEEVFLGKKYNFGISRFHFRVMKFLWLLTIKFGSDTNHNEKLYHAGSRRSK